MLNMEAYPPIDPQSLLATERRIHGCSAVLLPFLANDRIDWASFERHLQRTREAGLVPAVNMDTGYAHLIGEDTRIKVLKRSRQIMAGESFIAGAFVGDAAGAQFDADAYRRQIDEIQSCGGTPIVFQSFGLTQQPDAEIVRAYQQIANFCDAFLAFELGSMFAPFGRIYSLAVYEQLMALPQCVGAKHSSLRRDLEWQRLALRNRVRPDFRVYTGNDLAIDMVMYGSDYLLGLSSFAPDAFAKRDRGWFNGESWFYELNDLLQYLGFFAFRPPVPAYKHSAAMFLHERGWLKSDRTHPQSPTRPASDREILKDIVRRLDAWLGKGN